MNYKNVFLTVLALLILSFAVQAQTYLSESFESVSPNLLPSGWVSVGSGIVTVRNNNAHGGSHCVRFYGAVSNVVVLPEISVPVNTTQVTLWTKAGENSPHCGTFQVGYVTDVNDENTFVALRTISYADYVTYQELAVHMNLAPAGARIAFRHMPLYAYYEWYCDDVTIEALPSCLPVTNLTAIAGLNSIMLNWSDANNSNNYTVVNLTTGDTLVTAYSAHAYTVPNLSPSTAYAFGVISNCSTTDVSSMATISTHTVCSSFSLPFIEDFEDGVMPLCWTPDGNWPWSVGTGDLYPDPGAHTGTYNIRVTSDIPSDITSKLISPRLDLSNQSSSVQLSFWHIQRSWYNATDSLRVLYRTSESTPWVRLAGYCGPIEEWREENLTLPNLTATYQIAFEFFANWGYGVAIDDIRIEVLSSCSHVTNLTATSTSNSVTLNWTDAQNTSATYTVCEASSGNVIATNCNGNTYTVSGLTPATTYTFSVVANCSATNSSMPTAVNAQTGCGVFPLPFYEDFNSLTYGIPLCWDNSEGNITLESYRWKCYNVGHSGVGLRFDSYINEAGSFNILSTPPVAISENSILSFWCKNPDGGDLSVLASIDGGATRNILVTNLTAISDWIQIELPLDSATYTGHNVTVYFQATSNWGDNDAYIYLDDVSVVPVFIPAPVCLPVEQLLVDSVGTTSVSLSWESDAASFTVMNDTVLVATGITNINYTVTDLTPATHYTFSVIANCSDNNSSDTVSVSATTSVMMVDITAVPNDSLMGSVTGSGSYPADATIVLTAIPNVDYHFIHWKNADDSVLSTMNPYYMTVSVGSADTIYAVFAIDTCQPVTNLLVDSVSETTLSLSWTGTAANYTIYEMTDANLVDTVTDLYYMVTGLMAATHYTFEVIANCSATNSSLPVSVDATTDTIIDTVSVAMYNGTSKWKLYPNPANTIVTVEAEGMHKVTVFDATGREVESRCVNSDTERFDIGKFDNGVYFFRIEGIDCMTVRKCVISH